MTTQRHRLKPIFSRFESIRQGILSNIVSNDIDAITMQNFIESLQIVTQDEGRQSLIMNKPQEQIWHWYLDKKEKKIPARGICVKGRRFGVSTLIEAICFADVFLRPYRFSQIVAHDWKGSLYLFGISKRFFQYMPKNLRNTKPLSSNTNRTLHFSPPHDSLFQVASANTPALASSELIHNLHWSEVAKCPNPPLHDAMTSILQCVPSSWDTLVFLESTAKGAYNLFHQKWLGATDKDSDYDQIFLSWKDFPLYSLPALKASIPIWTPEERAYMKKYGVTVEQMLWAKKTRKDKCHNSWSEFHQEYPWTADLAFQSSGTPWFEAEAIQALRQNMPTTKTVTGTLEFISDTDPVVEFSLDEDGPIEILYMPTKGRNYVIGADISGGVGADYTVVQILLMAESVGEPHVQVAKFRTNRIAAEDAGIEIYKLGVFYNRAFAGVEANNQGITTLTILEHGHAGHPQTRRGYPNLYYYTPLGQKQFSEGPRLGWLTTSNTKELMLGHMKQIVTDQELQIFSENTLIEMSGYDYDAQTRKWVQKNINQSTKLAHDDEIASIAIALQMVSYYRDHKSFFRAEDGSW